MRQRNTIVSASIIIFIVWTAIAVTPLMLKADRAIFRSLHRYLPTDLDRQFVIVRAAGSIEVATVLVLLTGIVLIRTGRARLAVMLWLVFIGGNTVELLGKHLFPQLSVLDPLNRLALTFHPPPDLTDYFLEEVLHPPYGYPSGHAFRVLLLAAVGWLAWSPTAGRYLTLLRSGLKFGFTIVIGLVGVALVYLGDHRASEVIGGYLLGTICVAILTQFWPTPQHPLGENCTRTRPNPSLDGYRGFARRVGSLDTSYSSSKDPTGVGSA